MWSKIEIESNMVKFVAVDTVLYSAPINVSIIK